MLIKGNIYIHLVDIRLGFVQRNFKKLLKFFFKGLLLIFVGF